MNNTQSEFIQTEINNSTTRLNSNLLSIETITKELLNILSKIFYKSTINIYLLNDKTKKIEFTSTNKNLWPIPFYNISWFTSKIEKKNNKKKYIYIDNMKLSPLTDFKQLLKDQKKYKYDCNDGLFFNIVNEDKNTIGIIFIHSWHLKKKLDTIYLNFQENLISTSEYINQIINSIENFQIHQKIENLLSDKNKLTKKIQKEESSLNKRVLELTTLYETSSELNSSLNHKEIITKTINSMNKVLKFDSCCVFLNDIFNSNELFITLKNPFNLDTTDYIKNLTYNSIETFFSKTINFNKITISQNTINNYSQKNETTSIKSHTNIPLIFRDSIFGVISITSFKKNAFQKNEIRFLHTISNNIASTLGKLKLIRDIEKSKIHSVVESISDPIIVIDEKQQVNIINPYAKKLLKLNESENITKETLLNLLEKLRLQKLFIQVKKTKKPVINQQASYNNQRFSVNISPVIDKVQGYLGIIFLFRDISSIQQMDRIKSQRLDAISKVNLIVNSIQNLNDLLKVLIDFLLNISNCNMGSIQLKKNDRFVNVVHHNFPEKIRKSFRYINRKTISQEVEEKKQFILIDNYFSNPELDPNVKVLIDLYLCIPIIINNELIGIINLTRKYGSTASRFTKEDIETLITVTSLAATSIQNSLLYQEKVEKEKLDQEIIVATQIQKNLLPKKLPSVPKLLFGAVNIPAHKIGGDFYDFIELDKNRIGIIISDIVGKGIPAGLYMAVLKSILNRNILPEISPKETLFRLNNIMYNDPVINKFIPLFYGIFDLKNNEFKFSNAGHETCLILRDKNFLATDTNGFPLGGCKNQEFEEKKIKLKENDLFLFYTDGIIDIRNSENNLFGIKGIKQFLKNNATLPSQILLNKLKTHLNNFCDNPNTKDDITAIACQFNETYINKSKLILIKEISTSSEISKIKFIRNEVKTICKKANFNSKTISDIQLSVNEAQANIIEHAYLGDPNKKIIFEFKLYTNKLEIIIKDSGLSTKDIKLNKKTTIKINDIEGSGLGLFLINTLMDSVEYKPKTFGTKLKLVKYNT
mgnify:CR=1 FL=1|jgi:serine phosphatase RsbU (regulator of sigma subunit)/anti-sigma regulatory factor (Ser/Thr protein kinase)/PAS domain-containing protein